MTDQQRIDAINLILEGTKKIIHTMGLYPNGDRVHNGVDINHLVVHMNYNLEARPGRALFIEGICFHKGIGIKEETILQVEAELKEKDIQMLVITAPYR